MDFFVTLVLRYALFTVALFLLGVLMHYFFYGEDVNLSRMDIAQKNGNK